MKENYNVLTRIPLTNKSHTVRFILLTLFIVLLGGHVHSQTVYKTPSGKKYHTQSCRYVKNVSSSLSTQDAINMGLGPCTQCKPGTQVGRQLIRSNPHLGIKPGEAQGKRVEAVRCKGQTKKGTRCKRTTKNINGYCFQHEE